MKCPICNQEVTYSADNCPHCGYNLPKSGLSSHHPEAYQYYVPNGSANKTEVQVKHKKIVYYGEVETRPISAWGYVGYNILYSIPVIGFIIWLVHVFSYANVNRRNYARSFFCAALLGLIISIVYTVVMVILLTTGVVSPEALQEWLASLNAQA